MQPFTERAIKIIHQIPMGKVMTYGQVASLAGSPRAARQVVRLLHSMSGKYDLPWHRVINVKGEIAIMDEESRMIQKWRLEEEGVEVSRANTVDLKRFQCQ